MGIASSKGGYWKMGSLEPYMTKNRGVTHIEQQICKCERYSAYFANKTLPKWFWGIHSHVHIKDLYCFFPWNLYFDYLDIAGSKGGAIYIYTHKTLIIIFEFTYNYMYMCIYICIYSCTCIYLYVFIYMYMYMYIYMHSCHSIQTHRSIGVTLLAAYGFGWSPGRRSPLVFVRWPQRHHFVDGADDADAESRP